MTQEESIQVREINAIHQRGSRTRRAQRLASSIEVVQEQVHHHQPRPVEEICQFCQAVKWKDETANSRNRKDVLTQLHDPPQEFKQLCEDPLFVVKVRSYIIIIAFTSMGSSLAGSDRIDE